MEHLRRNTNNDRIIYTLESLKKENERALSKELNALMDKIVNVCTGILSSLISGTILSIVKNEGKVSLNTVPALILLFVIFFGFWYVSSKFILPYFYKILYKERIDIGSESTNIAVKRFNIEIMQKVSEIAEIVGVIEATNIPECKRLNFISSMYKLQEITNFFYQKFKDNKVKIRKTKKDGSTETFRYEFNIYAVSAVLTTVIDIRDKMKILAEDSAIKSLEGYELLQSDLNNISKKLDEIHLDN